ncbi:hypothetical protein [Luteimonas sp. R10]|uniref:hypothetical protein n=1 Tax=Luteimonas sp. R10 TaxID=3108176 RepID=UPI0030925C08|nr:hypothetical protein U3649_00055 [Luteimonas sp. R10]
MRDAHHHQQRWRRLRTAGGRDCRAAAGTGSGGVPGLLHPPRVGVDPVGEITRSIAADTLRTIDEVFPEPLEGEEAAADPDASGGLRWYPVPATQMGYIETVDRNTLLELARKREAWWCT